MFTWHDPEFRREILGVTFLRPDPVIAAVAAKEMRAGRDHVRRQCDEWRAEVGMPTRSQESIQGVVVKINAVTTGARAAAESLSRAFAALTAALNRNPQADEPTPIYDAVVQDMGGAA
jgi:hypothetical protein